MNIENTQNLLKADILDLYYGESDLSLREISTRHGVSFETCQMELKKLVLISETYQKLPEYSPSQISLNKISVYSKERAVQLQSKPFWQMFLRPAYSWSMVLIVGFVSYLAWMNRDFSNTKKFVAESNLEINLKTNTDNAKLLKDRLLRTALDYGAFSPDYEKRSYKKYYNSNVEEVSIVNQDDQYSLDEELNQKMLSKDLSSQDVETLYFRARKLEKQGFYQEALHDYIFLAKNYPSFEYQKAIPLAVVRCYEELGNKQTALSILEDYERAYGTSDDILFWKDQLKSETF